MRKKLTIFCCFVFSVTCAQQAPENYFDGKSWWDHIKVLAADDLEGRETGSPGLRKAEAYVVQQLKQAGLQPAGSNSFYQPMKFVSRQIVENDSSAFLRVPPELLSGCGGPLPFGPPTKLLSP